MDMNNNQMFIVSLDNGIHNEEPITMKTFNNFQDGSQLVQLNETVFGIYKNNSGDPNTSYIDDYDIIKSDIAELLDIRHENNRRIVTEDKNIGIFTELNYSQNLESRISITNILQSVINNINAGLLDEKKATGYNEVLQMTKATKDTPLDNNEDIKKVIDLGLNSIFDKLEIERKIPLENETKKNIRKNYIRMILFDYIVNRKYRNYDYSIITKIDNNNNQTWENSYFAPISVSININKENSVPDNIYMINNKYVKKEKILPTLYEYYYKDIKKLTETFSDALKLYKDAISRIIYNNTNLNKAKELEKIVANNFEEIAKIKKEKENKEYKEKKINKVERTMATQSINVKITNKLDLIQKKYPVNLKDHPELLESQNTKEKDEKVKLIVEEEKNKDVGFTSTIIITSVVALICGIGAGIASILLLFGN